MPTPPPRVTEHEVRIKNLDPRHDGVRVAQLSDIHVGNMTPASHVRAAIAVANAAKPDLVMLSVNIDPKIAPTHLVEPGQPLPFAEGSFDAVICLNTLEHIYDSVAILHELFRVVKPGGQVHVMVPFMFRIHGHPDDYFRATPSWWRESFSRVGFSALELVPLVWGRASTAAVVPGFRGLLPRLRLHLAMLRDVGMTRLTFRGPTLSGARGERICNTAPGWFMAGTK